MRGSDDQVAGLTEGWREAWNTAQNPTKDKAVSIAFWGGGGGGSLGGTNKFGT